MTWLRRLLQDSPALAAIVIAAALAMRLALPSGLMLTTDHMVLKVSICADATHGAQTRDIVIPASPNGSERDDGQHKDGGTCPFGALSPALVGTDPLLLALALVYLCAISLGTAAALRVLPADGIRPPSRAPPVRV